MPSSWGSPRPTWVPSHVSYDSCMGGQVHYHGTTWETLIFAQILKEVETATQSRAWTPVRVPLAWELPPTGRAVSQMMKCRGQRDEDLPPGHYPARWEVQCQPVLPQDPSSPGQGWVQTHLTGEKRESGGRAHPTAG